MWRAILLAALLHGALAVTLQSGTEDALEEPVLLEADESTEDYEEGGLTEFDPADELTEDAKFERELNALGSGPVPIEESGKPGVSDVMNHVHQVPIEEEEALNGGYIFDVDDNNRNPQQRCYVRNQGNDKSKMPDNIENSIVDAQDQLNDDGTNRAQWAKCLPPPMYTLLSVESFGEGDIYNGRYEKRMRNATDFYATLKWLHNEACAHIQIRLEHDVMLANIREEVNYRSRHGIGYKIKTALNPIIMQIVEQYHSTNPKVNAANAKTFHLLKNAIGPLKKALRVAKHSSMVTLENGEGRRRDTAEKSASELLKPLYDNVMKFSVDEMGRFLKQRPGPLDDMMTGDQKRGLGNPVVGSDGLPDALKNVGNCGKPQFDYAGYVLYTITISQNSKGDVTILTKDGWKLPDQVVAASMNVPLRTILPPDAYEVETKTTSYQDDLFAQGNLACADRADGTWTLVSYDRNSNENKVTATQEEGYFCVWMLNDLLVLPENQRAGFSNTEFIAESPQEMARIMNGDVNNYKKYFPKPGEKYKYYHCHYGPRNSAAARVHSFQHQAERHYPGGIRQYCNCDWRRMGMVVSRCDCTLDAKANGGCRRVEMEMLNEHTQFDLWRKDGNKKVPSRVALVHGDLAEGKIKSYTYNNNRRRRNPDNENIYQADTGRVRATTNGNGGNNVVCSVGENGVPSNAAGTLNYARNKGNIQAKSVNVENANDCAIQVLQTGRSAAGAGGSKRPFKGGLNMDVFYFNQGNNLQNLAGRNPTNAKTVVRPESATSANGFYFPNSNGGSFKTSWPGFQRSTQFAVRWWGSMNIEKTDNFNFLLESDDGSKLYINNEEKINNDNRRRGQYQGRSHFQNLIDGRHSLRIEYMQRDGNAGFRFKMQHWSPRKEVDYNKIFTADCGSGDQGAEVTRSFFTDKNNDGLMNYPECASNNQACTKNGKEFPLRDIYAPNGAGGGGRRRNTQSTMSSPAGGVNFEFVDKDGKACDILNLKRDCKPADAGHLHEGRLVRYLAKFCDVPAALYKVPVEPSGNVPQDFGAVTYPVPIFGYNEPVYNFRAKARAEMGKAKGGTYLFCQPGQKDCKGNEPLAVQGQFNGIQDERVYTSKEPTALKSKFYPTVGGSTAGNVPSAVNTKWTQAGTTASGVFNNDVLTRYRRSKNEGTLYAQERVKKDSTRGEGVTCLNGKYVYARKEKDGSRPVVSTLREGLNRNGPLAANGQWSCRYVGVHCNANNCNNNGNTEVAGPFVEPKIRKKAVVTTTTTTPQSTTITTTTAPACRRRSCHRRRRSNSDAEPTRRRRRNDRRRRRGKHPATPAPAVSGKAIDGRRRRRRQSLIETPLQETTKPSLM